MQYIGSVGPIKTRCAVLVGIRARKSIHLLQIRCRRGWAKQAWHQEPGRERPVWGHLRFIPGFFRFCRMMSRCMLNAATQPSTSHRVPPMRQTWQMMRPKPEKPPSQTPTLSPKFFFTIFLPRRATVCQRQGVLFLISQASLAPLSLSLSFLWAK